jgi:hypothetical protein
MKDEFSNISAIRPQKQYLGNEEIRNFGDYSP